MYPQYDKNGEECTLPSNQDSLEEISHNYHSEVAAKMPKSANDDDQNYQIEYFCTNIKSLMADEPRYMAKMIAQLSDRDITYLDLKPLQKIIDFKWDTYGQGYYKR